MASWQKELKGLLKDQANAQRKGDLREESRICNCIGVLYSAHGDYKRAYKMHLQECSLSESVGDRIGAAIAQRRIGECLCELQRYEEALEYQRKHLRASRGLGDLMEEQRSLATAGRMLYMWAEVSGGESRRTRLLEAQQANLQSLEVCDRLQGVEKDSEVMDMRCRVYLNLGLCHELLGDGERGLKFMKKAFVTARELKDMETVIRCHMSMGSLHTERGDLDKALQSYEEARKVARKEKIAVQEAEAFEYMAATYAGLEDFHSSKQSYKAACKLFSRQGMDREDVTRSLRKVRAVQHLVEQLKEPCELPLEEQRCRFDRLGDHCTSLGLHKVALRYYRRALELAESLSVDRKTLASAIVSVAVTCGDCGDHHTATRYYEREMALWRGESPLEEFESWVQIARSRHKAGDDHEAVHKALEQALSAAQQLDCNQKMVSLYSYMSEFYRSVRWDKEAQRVEKERAQLVALDPAAAESSEDEEDSQDRADEGMTSTESSSDEEERQMSVSLSGVARLRKKSRLTKRNEKGETLLHLAAIQGNTRIAEQLILEGACVNDKDNFGWTPLHEACNWGHLDMVRLLMDHGASPNDTGRLGSNSLPPLHDACSNMHVEVVWVLLEGGADPSARSGRGQTALDQVTEMLKLTKETLANSSDGQTQAKIAETSDSARCLETIAKLLMSHMPQGEREGETISSTPSNNRDYLMTEGASASRSQSPHEGASHVLSRRVPVDRTGRGALEDGGGDTQPHPLNRSGSFTSHRSPQDASQSSVHHKYSPPALVFVDSPEEDEDAAVLATSKMVVDNWLEEDTRDACRKRQRERLPSNGSSSSVSKRPRASGGESRAQRVSAMRQGSLRRYPSGRGLTSQDSPEQLGSGPDMSFSNLVGEQLSPPLSVLTHPQPMATSPLSRGTSRGSTPGPSLPPSTAHMRVRVTIEHTTFLVPCPVTASPSFAWLADEASNRYSAQTGRRPRLALTTRDGAQLSLEDLLMDVLGHNEEVVGVIMGWDLPPLSEQYKACCKKVGQTPYSKVTNLLKDPAVLSLAGVHLKQSTLLPVLHCLRGQDSLTEINLQGTKLGQDSLPLLGGVLPSLPHLTTLDLSCCMLTALSLSILVTTMQSQQGREVGGTLHALRQLSVSYNHLEGGEGSLSLLVGGAPLLGCLHIEHCNLQLADLLENSTAVLSSLCEFKAGGNKLSSSGTPQSVVDTLAAGVKQKLDLSSVHAPGLGIGIQTGYLRLVSLNLHGCGVADSGLEAMQPSLVGHFPALQELTLSCNGLTAAALPVLIRIVAGVVLLTSLDVSGNQDLGPDSVLLIPAAVRASHLQRLLLSATGASSPLDGLIAELGELRGRGQRLHSPAPLQLLELSHNRISSSDHAALLEAWRALWPGYSWWTDSRANSICSITSQL